MKALVSVDAQLWRTSDGCVWSKTMYSYEFWKRYLNIFDSIDIVSRIQDVPESAVKGYLQCDGPNVNFIDFPMAIGAKQYIQHWGELQKAAREAVKGESCAIIRLPSISGFFIESAFRKIHKPYCVEVVVDPAGAYQNKFFQLLMIGKLKSAVHNANGTSYVTRYDLERKYPSYSLTHGKDEEHFASYYSSINLSTDYFYRARTYKDSNKKFHLIHVANNYNDYVKGHKEAIEVVQKLRADGFDVDITFVGDGKKRPEFEAYASELGVMDNVHFIGLVSSPEKVRELLIQSDMLLFPTRVEGLPRVIIEAMATGLPCVSTPVNGIPELLDKKDMVLPTDVDGFVKRIEYLLSNKEELTRISKRNFNKAHEYTNDVLQKRRDKFYSRLKKLAQK